MIAIRGAEGEIRTLTPLRELRPEHSVSTNSTTSACGAKISGAVKDQKLKCKRAGSKNRPAHPFKIYCCSLTLLN